MSEINASTTAAELVAAFGFSSLEQMGAYLKRYKSKTSSSDPMVQETAEKVLEAINSKPRGAKWKTGVLNQMIFGMIKGISDESERVRHHGIVGKALKQLAEQGLIEKPPVSNAAHSYYLRLEASVQPETPVQENQESAETPSETVEEKAENVVSEKPKARVRKKS